MTENQTVNICFFNAMKVWGGGEKWHLETASYMHHSGMDVSFILRKNTPLDKRIDNLPYKRLYTNVSSLSIFNPIKVFKVFRFFRTHNIDAVFLNSSSEMKLGSFAAFLAGVPTIIYARGLGMPVKASFINKLCFKYFVTDFLVNSKETRRNITRDFNGDIYGKEIKVIYHGIDINE